MAFRIAYNTIFELSIWHHHFLDPVGGADFIPPPSPGDTEEQTRLLIKYDVRNFLKIQPTETSMEVIRQLGLMFKSTSMGGVLVAKDTYVETDPAVKISLMCSVTDHSFFDYTSFDFNEIGSQLFYLTNFGLPHPAPRTVLSEAAGNPHLRDIHRTEWKPRVVRLAQSVPGTDTIVDVIDLNTSPQLDVLEFNELSIPDQLEYELDCRSLKEGHYRLEAPNISNEDYFLGLESEGGILGVFDFYLEGLNNAQYDIQLAKN